MLRTNADLAKLARDLENLLDRLREPAASIPSAAYFNLALHCQGLVDSLDRLSKPTPADLEELGDVLTAANMVALREQLVAALPPVGGGAPEASGWPDQFDEDLDGFAWEPTPLSVLAASEPDTDDSRAAWLSWMEAPANEWTEADQLVTHGCA